MYFLIKDTFRQIIFLPNTLFNWCRGKLETDRQTDSLGSPSKPRYSAVPGNNIVHSDPSSNGIGIKGFALVRESHFNNVKFSVPRLQRTTNLGDLK